MGNDSEIIPMSQRYEKVRRRRESCLHRHDEQAIYLVVASGAVSVAAWVTGKWWSLKVDCPRRVQIGHGLVALPAKLGLPAHEDDLDIASVEEVLFIY